jgi:hypothetical protein
MGTCERELEEFVLSGRVKTLWGTTTLPVSVNGVAAKKLKIRRVPVSVE